MFDTFFDAMAGALAFFYELSGESYGGSIILLTLAINLALLPLTLKGTRSMMQMQRLQPEMKALQAKHKDDKETLNRELMAFYKENSINPVGGCLPLLLQMPVFILLYQVVQGLTKRSDGSNSDFDPKYLNQSTELYQSLSTTNHMDWFGVDLSQSAQSVVGDDSIVTALPYLFLLLIVLVTSYVQQKQVSSRNPDAPANSQQKMLLRIMPAFFVLISWSLPAALTLYFATANIFRVCQQELISRTMYRHQRAAAKDGKAAARAGEVAKGKGKADAIEAKSTPAGPAAAASGLMGKLLGRDADTASTTNGSSNGSSNGTNGAVSESKGKATPKRSPAGASASKPKAKPKAKPKGSKATAGRTTPSGSLPQPRPRKRKRK